MFQALSKEQVMPAATEVMGNHQAQVRTVAGPQP
jgi:hypothetical protein